jgi:acyl-CoA synthetase (AMP-forming)/AMP-acid ligase II
MISHRNVIANVIQMCAFEESWRKKDQLDVVLGLLPYSHIYALVVITHVATYRGEEVVCLPKFEFKIFLETIQNSKINTLYLVPPIIIAIAKQPKIVAQYDLSSVASIFTGAAPLGEETAQELSRQFPSWAIRQGYGLTETCTVVSSTNPSDVFFGSSGSLIPAIECRIVDLEGKEVTGYNQPGELLVRSPSVVLGYLKNQKATEETFIDGWMHTGDEAVFKKSEQGHEHLFIVDRIKELIKVKVSTSSTLLSTF